MEKNMQVAINKMRESVEKMGSSADRYGDQTLLRFLDVRSMDPEKAAELLVEWQQWRAKIAPWGYIDEKEIMEQLENRKAFLQGPTKDGHPLLIIQTCKHSPSKDILQLKKFVVYMLDKTIASSLKGNVGNEKMVIILDMQKVGLRNVDAQGLMTVFHYVKSYYPGTLAKMYILSMPRIFVSVWKLLSTFMEKAVLEKVNMVKNDKERVKMLEEIGHEGLPEEYGGRAKLTLIQDVKLHL